MPLTTPGGNGVIQPDDGAGHDNNANYRGLLSTGVNIQRRGAGAVPPPMTADWQISWQRRGGQIYCDAL